MRYEIISLNHRFFGCIKKYDAKKLEIWFRCPGNITSQLILDYTVDGTLRGQPLRGQNDDFEKKFSRNLEGTPRNLKGTK